MTQLVGQRGEVTRDLVDGNGQVKIGDTVWGAEPVDASATLVVGDKIIVDSTRSNTAVVRKA
jgi:membrane protein implicated in regulation of membrane protease activity